MTSMRPNRRQVHERLHAELAALASAEVENPTEFQRRMQARIDEMANQGEALLDAALNDPVDV
jgi:hypothetical protein